MNRKIFCATTLLVALLAFAGGTLHAEEHVNLKETVK